MLDDVISLVVNRTWDAQRHRVSAKADSIVAHSRFSDRVDGHDPRLRPVLKLAYRHLSKPPEPADQKVVDVDTSGINTIERLCESFYAEDEAQFGNIARMSWLLNSFSTGLRRSGLYELNRIGSLNQKTSLEDLAEIRGFRIATYECPGLIETLAEFNVGYAMLMAAATRTHPVVMLYGENGSARNRHLSKLTVADRESLYTARKTLLESVNFEVTPIEIPQGFFSVPANVAIARALNELTYYESRGLDSSFVDILKEPKTPSQRALSEVVNDYDLSNLTPEDYRVLIERLREPLARMGSDLLRSEGVNDIAGIILRSADYKNPDIIRVFEEGSKGSENTERGRLDEQVKRTNGLYLRFQAAHGREDYKAAADAINDLKGHLDDVRYALIRKTKQSDRTSTETSADRIYMARQKRSTVWRRVLGYRLEKEELEGLSPRNPEYEAVERSIAKKYRAEFERKAAIWRRIFPSDFPVEIINKITGVNIHFPELEPEHAKQHVDYFMGEIITIMGELLKDRRQAHVKIGNETERYWDDCVYSIFGNSKLSGDALWLLDGFFPDSKPNGNVPAHGVLGSVLYSHFTFLGASGRVRSKYTSYGIPLEHVTRIPLISDSLGELTDKLSVLAGYDPDQLARIGVGAIYSFMNPGDQSPAAIARYRKNRDVLIDAAQSLPIAYQISVSTLDPRSIPEIIDARIRAEHSARIETSNTINTSYVTNAFNNIFHFETFVRQKREELRVHALEYIVNSIKDLNSKNPNRAVIIAEGYLSASYRDDYAQRVVQSALDGKEEKEAADLKIPLLAEDFFRLHCVPTRSRFADTKRMSTFLAQIGMEEVYDLNSDENLRVAHSHTIEALKYVENLRRSLNGLNEHYAALEQGASPTKSGKLPGISLEDFLNEAIDNLAQLGYRRQRLEETRRRMGTYNKGIGDIPVQLSTVIGDLREAVYQTLDLVLNKVDKADFMYVLQKRFTEKQKKLDGIIRDSSKKARNQDTASDRYKKGDVYPLDELYLLGRIDRKLREFEEGYMRDIQKAQDISTVMFPHELQQFAAMRNSIATWIKFYERANKYIEGSSEEYPIDPSTITNTSQSGFAIDASQAAKFFTRVFEHLRKEIGDSYFDSQRARAKPALIVG